MGYFVVYAVADVSQIHLFKCICIAACFIEHSIENAGFVNYSNTLGPCITLVRETHRNSHFYFHI